MFANRQQGHLQLEFNRYRLLARLTERVARVVLGVDL